ncbi:MAG: hypothetical protein GPJ54_04530 [Candidatus Heimdallarchaeota archaeon]|nr:hypothetical protein [Candidatus Heimdallarchaeota archaeon]
MSSLLLNAQDVILYRKFKGQLEMPKFKGLLLFIPSVLVIAVEFKYLIIDNIGESNTVTLNSDQYWALAIPVFVLSFLVAALVMWVGFTMIVTKEPIRMTYDSAYEEAAGAVSSKENNNDKENSSS